MSNTRAPDIDLESSPTINQTFRLQWEDAQNAYVLLYPEGMIKLNISGGEILSLCDGSNTIKAIIQQLTHKFPEATDIDKDILGFLVEANQQQWVLL